MWNSDHWKKSFADATQGLTEALEKTGDVITNAATRARQREDDNVNSRPSAEASSSTTTTTTAPPSTDDKDKEVVPMSSENVARNNANMAAAFKLDENNRKKVMKNLQMGWTSVVEGTKQAVDATREAMELERSRLEKNFLRKGFYKRDLNLPLDAEALRDAEVVYITDRIITMSHPAMASNTNPNITAQRKLAAVGHLLQRRHDGRFLIWNLSEVEYDISVLNDQVLTFSFPGSPSPPLGLLLKLLISMENWMKADDRNIAVVHCLSGKGRTSTVLSAFLCWMGEAGFGDINHALEYIALCKKTSPKNLTIPSQRRYASYFKNMLDGVKPSQPPLLLKRIIMSEAPKFAKGPPRENMEETIENEKALMGCAPYLQIFKGGKLIFTTAATLHVKQQDEELPFVQVVDGTVPFHVEEVIQGDILIRCRHLTYTKQRVSMFRAAFHTGYVPPNVLRLTKAQLDGACSDKRYPEDFFLDLIFEKVDTETATQHLAEQAEEENEDETSPKQEKGPIVKATNYDSMLQGDSRFWDVIMNRRKDHTSKDKGDPLWGPTVGRRRGDGKKKKGKKSADPTAAANRKEEGDLFETFSIGNEFDFLPEKEVTKNQSDDAGKDALMEALGAIDQDETDIEEVVFDDASASNGDSKITTSAASSITETIDSKITDEGTECGGMENKDTATKEQSLGAEGSEDDMEALLATTEDDLGDMDLGDFDDDDDDDLGDLEAMLNAAT